MSEAGGEAFTVGEHDDGRRLDRVVARAFGRPVSAVQRAMRTGALRVDGRRVEIGARARRGTEVRWAGMRRPPPAGRTGPRRRSGSRRRTPLRVIYRDEHLLVVDKPPGVAVHGGTGLVGGLVHDVAELIAAETGEVDFVPVPVHRLDRATSGLVVFALGGRALRGLHAQLRAATVYKRYVAYAVGRIEPPEGELVHLLCREAGGRGDTVVCEAGRPGARRACTRYRREGAGRLHGVELCRLRLQPQTGRRHQLRVQLAAAGCPIAGDRRYGDRRANELLRRRLGLGRLALHAEYLAFEHPVSGGPLVLRAPEPSEFAPLRRALERG